MKAADARRIVDELELSDHIRGLADNAPPLPERAVDIWRRAVSVVIADRPPPNAK